MMLPNERHTQNQVPFSMYCRYWVIAFLVEEQVVKDRPLVCVGALFWAIGRPQGLEPPYCMYNH